MPGPAHACLQSARTSTLAHRAPARFVPAGYRRRFAPRAELRGGPSLFVFSARFLTEVPSPSLFLLARSHKAGSILLRGANE